MDIEEQLHISKVWKRGKRKKGKVFLRLNNNKKSDMAFRVLRAIFIRVRFGTCFSRL
jgi:hypothetical protein